MPFRAPTWFHPAIVLATLFVTMGCDSSVTAPPANRLTGVGNPTVTTRVEGRVLSAVDSLPLDSIEVALSASPMSGFPVQLRVLTDSVGAYSLVVSVRSPCFGATVYVSLPADGWKSQLHSLSCGAQRVNLDFYLETEP